MPPGLSIPDRAAGPAVEVSEAVRQAKQRIADAEAQLQSIIDTARRLGFTWQEIGDLLGTTRQAAFQRFGRTRPEGR